MQSDKLDFEVGADAFQQGNFAEALKMFQQMAEQGDARAQYALGMMHDHGQGVAQDDNLAFEWFFKAAEQGMVKAQNTMSA